MDWLTTVIGLIVGLLGLIGLGWFSRGRLEILKRKEQLAKEMEAAARKRLELKEEAEREKKEVANVVEQIERRSDNDPLAGREQARDLLDEALSGD